MHISVPIDGTMEFINATEISPLISHCNVKVCYVSDEPNRNGTVITKPVAEEMGKKLPGSPVVGYFNEKQEDFEGHNREIKIGSGEFKIVDVTKPYGFVPTDAKVWFQKFTDDDGTEREYLVTECYLWTEAYPEAQRVIEQGNNQSMELNENGSGGYWAKNNNSGDRIFIYNEALIEKLCILGENVEPCFEGAQFKTEFSLENVEELRTKMFSMMEELQNTLREGGKKPMIKDYAIDIGGALHCLIADYMTANYPEKGCSCWSKYEMYGMYEEDGQKFVIMTTKEEPGKMFRFDITYEEGVFEVGEPVEVALTFTSNFEAKDLEAFKAEYVAKKQEEEKQPAEGTSEDPEDKPEGDEPEDPEDDDDDKKKYTVVNPNPAKPITYKASINLDAIPEYVELNNKYEALQKDFAFLQEQVSELKEFKLMADRKDKKAMIDSFYMLSDEDKKDVIDNIDSYSLDDIEAKLSVICFRNKVDFNLNKPDIEPAKPEGLFNLNNDNNEPAWVQAIKENI